MTEVVVLPRPSEAVTELEPAEPSATRASRSVRPTAREVVTTVAIGLTIFGLAIVGFVVYLFGISQLEHARSQRALIEEFNALLASQSAPIGGAIEEGTPVAMLRAPTIGVREAVVEGTSGSQLTRGIGHLRSSPLPGQAGNVVMMGRRMTYGAPLYDLDGLSRGDEIRFVTGQGSSTYVVREVRTIAAGDDDVLQDTADDRLTLISSERFMAGRRLVAIARLEEDPYATRGERPNEVRSSELGLNRDGTSVLALLLWLQLLLLASLGTVWLLRRQRRWPAYLVCVPVLALLVLLVFDSFTPLLPSTL
jgi:sortase A